MPGPTGLGEQAPTLNESRRRAFGMLPREPLEITTYRVFGYSLMEQMKDAPGRRGQWYVRKLGKYQNQLQESASANRIPMQLLAAIILNELADIEPRDALQQQLISHLNSGSLGMAQIQVRTALDHGLLRGFLVGRHANTAARLLAVPQYAIEAAAREIRHLLDAMELNPGARWPARFNFVPPLAGDRNPARYYRPGAISVNPNEDQEDREALLAAMVAAAYNFGDKFVDVIDPPTTTPGSWIHGLNAAQIARDLFRLNLFGSPAPVVASSSDRQTTRHIVRPGDSLSKLAQEYYGEAQLWPVIYDVNRAIIGDDPNRLTIGQDLVIPSISSMQQVDIANARRKASQWYGPSPVRVEPLR